MKTHDAPLYTTDATPTICGQCGANREALFALPKAQGARSWAHLAIAACPLCAAAWEKERTRA